jgi:DnaK suppressor protein
MKVDDRQMLLEKIAARIAELETTISNDESLAMNKQEQSDDAAANMHLNIQASVSGRVKQDHQWELSQLARSLVWLNSSNAGSCEQCEREIPVARLMAVLVSQLCLSCAEENNI